MIQHDYKHPAPRPASPVLDTLAKVCGVLVCALMAGIFWFDLCFLFSFGGK